MFSGGGISITIVNVKGFAHISKFIAFLIEKSTTFFHFSGKNTANVKQFNNNIAMVCKWTMKWKIKITFAIRYNVSPWYVWTGSTFAEHMLISHHSGFHFTISPFEIICFPNIGVNCTGDGTCLVGYFYISFRVNSCCHEHLCTHVTFATRSIVMLILYWDQVSPRWKVSIFILFCQLFLCPVEHSIKNCAKIVIVADRKVANFLIQFIDFFVSFFRKYYDKWYMKLYHWWPNYHRDTAKFRDIILDI